MKAIILAGGIGTRLRPLSCTRPKLLFPLLNKPLLDGTFERLSQAGFDGVVLAVKYMAEKFMQRYGDSSNGLSVCYSIEKKPMHTGGAIKYAEQLIGHDEPFLVLNGDIFTTLDYNKLVKKHKQSNAVATIALYQVEDPSRYGTVKLTQNNQITQFVEKAPKEKAPSNLINAGVYVLDPKIFEYISAGRPVSIEREVFPVLAQQNKLFGYEFNDIWIDIGKPEDYLKANKILLDAEQEKQVVENNFNVAKSVTLNEPVRIDSSVTIGQDSNIGPYVVLGKDVVLGRNVAVDNSVVFPESIIMDNASVKGAIIGEGVTVGKGAKVMAGCVIGDYVSIKDNVTVSRNVFVCHSKDVTENVPENKRII
ncbi:MAG: NDP-sugar synthase [Candidatus Bathyarchaeum tardum]|nr:MAG: NDP-sugar synthase [Candidatus Bathyarchaeum tardum]